MQETTNEGMDKWTLARRARSLSLFRSRSLYLFLPSSYLFLPLALRSIKKKAVINVNILSTVPGTECVNGV